MSSLSDDQLEALLDGRAPPKSYWTDKHGKPIRKRFLSEAEQDELLPEPTVEEMKQASAEWAAFNAIITKPRLRRQS